VKRIRRGNGTVIPPHNSHVGYYRVEEGRKYQTGVVIYSIRSIISVNPFSSYEIRPNVQRDAKTLGFG
jgi:hypothetical protein